MLPKLNKNLFQTKTKQIKDKAFNFKAFLVSILFAGTTAMASVSTPTTQEMNSIIANQKQEVFTLKPSIETTRHYAYHSSHRSHYSHSSHRSHYSSRR